MAITKTITIEELVEGYLVTMSEYDNEELYTNVEYEAPKKAYAPTPQEVGAKISSFLSK